MKSVLLFACLSLIGANLALAQNCPDAYPSLAMKAYALDDSQAGVSGAVTHSSCFIARDYGGEVLFSKVIPNSIEISLEVPVSLPDKLEFSLTAHDVNSETPIGKIENVHFLVDSQDHRSVVFDLMDVQSNARDPKTPFLVDFKAKAYGDELYFGRIAVEAIQR